MAAACEALMLVQVTGERLRIGIRRRMNMLMPGLLQFANSVDVGRITYLTRLLSIFSVEPLGDPHAVLLLLIKQTMQR